MRKALIVFCVIATGCKRPLVETTKGQTLAQEVKAQTRKALSQEDLQACNRVPPIIHDPSLDNPITAQGDPQIDKKIASDFAIGEERWIWQIVKDDDGKLYVSRYVTGFLRQSDDWSGVSDIHVRRTSDGFEVDCKSHLLIWLNKQGPSNDKEAKYDLIPVVGIIDMAVKK